MAAGLAVIAAADAALTAAAARGWALSACVATAGVGLGLSSVAATALGTTVPATLRGTASGIINTNTAAQLGTATGIAAMLLIEAVTTGPPEPGTAPPTIAWAAAAAIAAAGALAFSSRPPSRQEQLTTPSGRHPPRRSCGRTLERRSAADPSPAGNITGVGTACGARHDRGVNAANVLQAAGLAVAACGDGVRPPRTSCREATVSETGTSARES